MASEVATFLREKYLDSFGKVSDSKDPIFGRFKAIVEKLKSNSTVIATHESISWLYDLNDALTDWQILKEQKKSMKIIFSCFNVAEINERRSANTILDKLEKQVERSWSSPLWSQPKFQLEDQFTFYKPDQVTSIDSFDEHEKIVRWLSASGEGFKAVGIYGMGGSGKTALVKSFLKHENVSDKFDRSIWACLSDFTGDDEIDIRIVKYLLYRLGLDPDSLADNIDEDEGWLMKELERRLAKGKYVIVFDDVWYCSKWFTGFFHKLAELNKNDGGAVIVTSRIKTVAEKIFGDQKNILIHLNPSTYKESSFLKRMVCQSHFVKADGDEKEIISHCHGLALAAKMLPEVRTKYYSKGD